MRTLTLSIALDGPEPRIVTVESSYTSGFSGIQLVGSSSELCRDGKERAKTALEHMGIRLSHKRILINLAPSHIPKAANHFDLPIAVSLACLTRDEPSVNDPSQWLFAAELSIDGSLRPCRALVPMALCALKAGLKGLILAQDQAYDGQTLQQLSSFRESPRIYYFSHLDQVLRWLFWGESSFEEAKVSRTKDKAYLPNFGDMQLTPELEKLALTCALGRHSLLLRGSPGSGKSMFAYRLPSLISPLQGHEHLEILDLHSRLWEQLPQGLLEGHIPFRNPHHTASPQALLGTDQVPGELSLAHRGLLFLDELPEFRRDVLEALREPLELGYVQIARASRKWRWPAAPQFIAACNNCPCGWFGSNYRLCRCSTSKLQHYWTKLSGPLLDRIDLHYCMPERPIHKIASSTDSTEHSQSSLLSEALEKARDWLATGPHSLADGLPWITTWEQLRDGSACSSKEWHELLSLLEAWHLSQRALIRVLRVSRTLANLDRSGKIRPQDVLQALRWQHIYLAKMYGEDASNSQTREILRMQKS